MSEIKSGSSTTLRERPSPRSRGEEKEREIVDAAFRNADSTKTRRFDRWIDPFRTWPPALADAHVLWPI
ncbi:MAG: hypothetical protein HYR85_19560 [Planctomycetes bacterium]|nr:hypothetical protein [Planctomycetota bacterium]